MSNPFQEQFLKAGLTNKKKVKQAQRSQRIKARQKRKGEIDELDPGQQSVLQAEREKAEKDRLLNKKRDQQAKQKAAAAEVRQLVETNRINIKQGDICFHFEDHKKIKQIQIDRITHGRLISGQLCVVRFDEEYALVPASVAEKMAQRQPDAVVWVQTVAEQKREENDHYADYQVPDDLMW